MVRPAPLSNISSARSLPSDHQILTPRTPHSRSARAEEGYSEVELESIRDNDLDDDHRSTHQQQSEPLLSRDDHSSSNGFYDRGKTRVKELDLNTVLSRLPVVVLSLLAMFLFFLFLVSYKKPGTLEYYVGVTPPGEGVTITSQAARPSSTPSIPHPELVISYENYTSFPLQPDEYRRECSKMKMFHGGYWVPPPMGVMDVLHRDEDLETAYPIEGQATGVCKSTITYLLDGKVGLLADLALMAQAAALARERDRTFFVDDTYWNRGKWSDFFQDVRARQPGPEPGCRPPPPEELVACPRLARHWVINSRTADFHFTHMFYEQYEDPYAHSLTRQKPIYLNADESLRTIIRPNADIAKAIREARGTLGLQQSAGSNADSTASSYVSVHVRRGDRKPSSYSYRGGYVPIEDFVTGLERFIRNGTRRVFFSSDSPGALSEFQRALTISGNRDLEVVSRNASRREYVQAEFALLDEEERRKQTKEMVIDFALLSGFWAWDQQGDLRPDGVVCTISSSICKLAALGLGWDRAFGAVNEFGDIDKINAAWLDVDEKGAIVPAWKGFDTSWPSRK